MGAAYLKYIFIIFSFVFYKSKECKWEKIKDSEIALLNRN